MTTGGTAAACRARAATHSTRAFALFAVRPSAALILLSAYLTSAVSALASDFFCPSRRVFRRYDRPALRSRRTAWRHPARARARARARDRDRDRDRRPPTADRRPPTADPDPDLDLDPDLRPDPTHACLTSPPRGVR